METVCDVWLTDQRWLPSNSVRLSEAAPRAEVSVTPLAYSSARVNDVQDIDTETDNPQLVACYVKDIYKYLLHMEATHFLYTGFLKMTTAVDSVQMMNCHANTEIALGD